MATLVSGNEYQVNGITGTRNGAAITSLLPPGLTGDINIDDLIFVPPDSPNGFLSDSPSNSGFAFTTAGGTFNPYFDPDSGNTFEYVGGSSNTPGTQIALTISPTPEPSYYVLLGIGIVALVLAWRRKLIA